MSIDRTEHEKNLKRIFGIDRFYDEQWDAIRRILSGERILMIQRTGFGKSLCYQYPATQFSGLTVIFSPLIALMRDQVKSLNSKGISARYINSEQSPEENSATIEAALNGEIKILYIAPERQENQEWIEATRRMNLSMVVIDEAHTISVWGHDFRPAFRRIINLIKLLPQDLPVLATTATATKRVQNDIEKQIGGQLTTIRGSLVRSNFNLYVIRVQSEDEKLVWLAQHLNNIDGTGLVYTGTRVDTESYAKWLVQNGVNAVNYNAGHDAETRKDIENGLMENRYKCVVSTNALGMGIDKADIRFIIHTQIPASPIHYYQEIGRAGRDGKPTTIVLFYNEHIDDNGTAVDYRLPKAFIDGARPSKDKYIKAINALKEEPLTISGLMKATNLKQTQVRVIKADLIEQGIVREVVNGKSKTLEYQFDAPELDTQAFETLRIAKLKDLESMIGYVYTDRPRMQYLCDFLDDDTPTVFSNCDNTTLSKQTVQMTDEWACRIADFHENYFPILEAGAKSGNMIDGVAASYYGVSNVGNAIHRSKYENGGDFPDFLLRSTLKAFWKKLSDINFDLVLYVPPTHSGDLVKNFAEKFANSINVPLSSGLLKVRATNEQKIYQNSYLKQENIKDAFTYDHPDDIDGKKILLLDDIYDSGATMKEIGRLLTSMGAELIVPIAIAKTVGGDIL
ncbi:MAG: RecQ family ATP-dependent DNA helicase [Bacteroidales bacterium]|nr:RecQ family ATP-dependent DNA helicase [Bacteroidales bacterium]MBR6131447.1 RecQ family ATP-dependent DNA helicase [Bacteroidales bacterium]